MLFCCCVQLQTGRVVGGWTELHSLWVNSKTACVCGCAWVNLPRIYVLAYVVVILVVVVVVVVVSVQHMHSNKLDNTAK